MAAGAAFGMVAGMSAPATGAGAPGAGTAAPERAAVSPGTSVLVIRRHWLPTTATPAGPPPAAAATPARPRPSQVAAPRPAPRPVTRTRGS